MKLVKIISTNDLELIDQVRQVIRNQSGIILIIGNSLQDNAIFMDFLRRQFQPNIVSINLGLLLSEYIFQHKNENIDLNDFLDSLIENKFTVLLDHIEILTDPYIQRDPIRFFLSYAKNRVLILNIPGLLRGEILDYGPNQREYELNLFNDSVLIIQLASNLEA